MELIWIFHYQIIRSSSINLFPIHYPFKTFLSDHHQHMSHCWSKGCFPEGTHWVQVGFVSPQHSWLPVLDGAESLLLPLIPANSFFNSRRIFSGKNNMQGHMEQLTRSCLPTQKWWENSTTVFSLSRNSDWLQDRFGLDSLDELFAV